MYYTGSIPPASIYETWQESIEITSADDGQYVDLSPATEITLRVRDPITNLDDLVITKSDGSITVPSLGIIQWKVDTDHMGTLQIKLYRLILVLKINGDEISLIIGSVSIVE